jgi:hypothetical protein
MRPKVEDYVNRPRDSKREHALASALRELPEEERFEFVSELITRAPVIGLHIAARCLRNKKYFEELLNTGLDRADASSIAHWLKCVAPKLGGRKVISILQNNMDAKPSTVAKAVYWLPSLIKSGDEHAQIALRELIDQMKQKGHLRAAKMIPNPAANGQVLFEPVDD